MSEVLVVDDDSSARESLAWRLEVAGADTYQVGSVFEAIECLERQHIDLVICGHAMPAGSSANLLAYVRRRGLPVRFLVAGCDSPTEHVQLRPLRCLHGSQT